MKKLLTILALILASVSARAQGYIIIYSTNFYSVPMTAQGSNGVSFAAANSLPLLTVPDFLAYMALHDFSLTNGIYHLASGGKDWNSITNPPPIPTTNNLVSTNLLLSKNYLQRGSNGIPLEPLAVSNITASYVISNLTVSGAGLSAANGSYSGVPSTIFSISNNMIQLTMFSQYTNASNALIYWVNPYNWRLNTNGNGNFNYWQNTASSENMLSPGWGTNWSVYFGPSPAPTVTPSITTLSAPVYAMYWSWTNGDNLLVNLGATNAFNFYIVGGWLAPAGASATEAHSLTLVNYGTTNVNLTWGNSSAIAWLNSAAPQTIAPNSLMTVQFTKPTTALPNGASWTALVWPNTNNFPVIAFTNTLTIPNGSPAVVTNLGVSGGVAWYQIGLPQGPQGPPATNAIYASNTWNLATITNGLHPGDIATVNSNGQTLVDVWMSNGLPILKPHW